MKKKFNEMTIGKRLKSAFNRIMIITSIVNAIGLVAVIVIMNRYNFTLEKYAFSQGDIGKAMVSLADTRSASRGIIGYDSKEIVDSLVLTHEENKKILEENIIKIENNMVSKNEKEEFAFIKDSLEQYFEVEEKVITLGTDPNPQKKIEAQRLAIDELAPAYKAVYSAFENLMNENINKGNQMHTVLSVLEIILISLIFLSTIFLILFSARISKFISNSISLPLNDIAKRFKTFTEGDLSSPFPDVKTRDEISEMRDEAQEMAEHLLKIIRDIDDLMSRMAEGNFCHHSQIEEVYTGDFSTILSTINKMNVAMSDTLLQVDEAAKQVSAGATNMAEAAQSLAEGANDQTTSIEELNNTFALLIEGVLKTSESVSDSYNLALQYAKEVESSRLEMQSMVDAMQRISETSQNIGKIIAEIEDIATQTNLLSLNAAIEAARAGEAGKGFAVVADQIRKLAEQSANSAVNSKALIEGSLREVNEGNEAAMAAAASLSEVVKGVHSIADSSKGLSEISFEQADAMQQAEEKIERISDVVQSNSVTAEESSATSQELAAQSISLSDLVGKFQLKNN